MKNLMKLHHQGTTVEFITEGGKIWKVRFEHNEKTGDAKP